MLPVYDLSENKSQTWVILHKFIDFGFNMTKVNIQRLLQVYQVNTTCKHIRYY